MARTSRSKGRSKPGRRLAAPARAVMQAFRMCQTSAPPFMSSCGIFPEVSESASDQLHAIVNDVAMSRLNKARHVRALQQNIRRLGTAANKRYRPGEIVDLISADLTALLAAEATAAYLFGLCVGMTVRTLPARLDQ